MSVDSCISPDDFFGALQASDITARINGSTLSLSKRFDPSSPTGFGDAESAVSIIYQAPQTQPGSTWGTDGASVGGLSAIKSGIMVMNRSGVSLRWLAKLRRLNQAPVVSPSPIGKTAPLSKGNAVAFTHPSRGELLGRIKRVNVRTASITCVDGTEWRVPHHLLRQITLDAAEIPSSLSGFRVGKLKRQGTGMEGPRTEQHVTWDTTEAYRFSLTVHNDGDGGCEREEWDVPPLGVMAIALERALNALAEEVWGPGFTWSAGGQPIPLLMDWITAAQPFGVSLASYLRWAVVSPEEREQKRQEELRLASEREDRLRAFVSEMEREHVFLIDGFDLAVLRHPSAAPGHPFPVAVVRYRGKDLQVSAQQAPAVQATLSLLIGVEVCITPP